MLKNLVWYFDNFLFYHHFWENFEFVSTELDRASECIHLFQRPLFLNFLEISQLFLLTKMKNLTIYLN